MTSPAVICKRSGGARILLVVVCGGLCITFFPVISCGFFLRQFGILPSFLVEPPFSDSQLFLFRDQSLRGCRKEEMRFWETDSWYQLAPPPGLSNTKPDTNFCLPQIPMILRLNWRNKVSALLIYDSFLFSRKGKKNETKSFFHGFHAHWLMGNGNF